MEPNAPRGHGAQRGYAGRFCHAALLVASAVALGAAPAMAQDQVLTFEIDPPFDTSRVSKETWAAVDTLMETVRSPHDPDWYDRADDAVSAEPLVGARQLLAAVPQLVEALAADAAGTRYHAAWILAQHVRTRYSLPLQTEAPLIEALRDPDARVREAAAIALRTGGFGDRTIEALIATLGDSDRHVRAAAMHTLHRFVLNVSNRHDRISAVIARLDDPDARVRIAAANTARWLVEHIDPALAALNDRWRNAEGADRLATAELLQMFWQIENDRTFAAYLDMLDEPDDRLREIGTAAVARRITLVFDDDATTDGEREELVRRLAAALEDRVPTVRLEAVTGLLALGTGAAAALEPLSRSLDREESFAVRVMMQDARRAIAGEAPAAGTLVRHPVFCVPGDALTMAGVAPWDSVQEVRERLGEPAQVAAVMGSFMTGYTMAYGYRFPMMEIDIASETYRVERLSATGPEVNTGLALRVGMHRDEVLRTLNVHPTPERMTAPLYVLMDCQPALHVRLSYLRFDDGNILKEIELRGEPPR